VEKREPEDHTGATHENCMGLPFSKVGAQKFLFLFDKQAKPGLGPWTHQIIRSKGGSIPALYDAVFISARDCFMHLSANEDSTYRAPLSTEETGGLGW